jgi:diguanylate cyclase (GGDEF)-like protein
MPDNLSPACLDSVQRSIDGVEPPAGRLRVLMIDASASDRQAVRDTLDHAGSLRYEVQECGQIADAWPLLDHLRPDAVILESRLPDGDFVAALERLAQEHPDAALLVLTRHGDEKTAVRAMKAGAVDYLLKDQALADPMHLDWAIFTAVYTKRLERENARLLEALRERNRELEELNRKLWELSLTDDLTGFFNRRYITSRLEEELARSIRYRVPLSVVMVDLDNFKQVNDRHGHQAGDQVLKDVANLFRGSLRDTDLAGRYGGEEFLLILTNTDVQGAEAFCNRLRHRLERQPIPLGEHTLQLTASFGIAEYAPESGTAEEIIRLADQHLYAAKALGRNRVVAAVPKPSLN